MTYDVKIGQIEPFTLDKPIDTGKKTENIANPFDSIFNAALDVVTETNNYQVAASQAQTELATGQTDDVLSLMLAQDRAYSSMNFTVQVTNKIIESYREIMRMQI